MFQNRVKVENPLVAIREDLPNKDFKFGNVTQLGVFYLVIPSSYREIYYLQLLDKNISVFVPSEGDGLLIRERDIIGL
tara:strand:+ start:3781 stop:4014 length:234 start_codon:yes stop_codon:yes gene_type:complete